MNPGKLLALVLLLYGVAANGVSGAEWAVDFNDGTF